MFTNPLTNRLLPTVGQLFLTLCRCKTAVTFGDIYSDARDEYGAAFQIGGQKRYIPATGPKCHNGRTRRPNSCLNTASVFTVRIVLPKPLPCHRNAGGGQWLNAGHMTLIRIHVPIPALSITAFLESPFNFNIQGFWPAVRSSADVCMNGVPVQVLIGIDATNCYFHSVFANLKGNLGRTQFRGWKICCCGQLSCLRRLPLPTCMLRCERMVAGWYCGCIQQPPIP